MDEKSTSPKSAVEQELEAAGRVGLLTKAGPYLALVAVLAIVAAVRIGRTDPQYEAGETVERVAYVNGRRVSVEEAERVAAAAAQAPAAAETQKPAAVEPPVKTGTAEADVAEAEVEEAAPEKPVRKPKAKKPAGMDAYLRAHVGQEVPFLHKGKERAVTLVKFDKETVVIGFKQKTLTLKRAELSDEQRALWK